MRPRHCQDGFSLLEALIGAVILALLVLIFLGAIPASYQYTSDDAVRVQAESAGEKYLDSIRQYIKSTGTDTGLPAAPVVQIDAGAGMFSGTPLTSPGAFTMVPSCAARSLFSFDCTVTVKWSRSGVLRSVQLESYIASQAGF